MNRKCYVYNVGNASKSIMAYEYDLNKAKEAYHKEIEKINSEYDEYQAVLYEETTNIVIEYALKGLFAKPKFKAKFFKKYNIQK